MRTKGKCPWLWARPNGMTIARVHFFSVGDEVIYKSRRYRVTQADGSSFYSATLDVAGMLISIEPLEGGRHLVVAEHNCSSVEV